MTNQKEQNGCFNCGNQRQNFIPGSVDDHCPYCGFKEGCCNYYEPIVEKIEIEYESR